MKRGTIEHPKTLDLARLLGIPLWQAVGLLESIWHWTAKYAPDGCLGKDPDPVARGIYYEGDSKALFRALIMAKGKSKFGFLRQNRKKFVVHGWQDHCDDATHMLLARRIDYFWDGSKPKVNRLNTSERERIDYAYSQNESVRTECAQNAHEKSELCALPRPAPPSMNIPPNPPPAGGTKKPEPKSKREYRAGKMRRPKPVDPDREKQKCKTCGSMGLTTWISQGGVAVYYCAVHAKGQVEDTESGEACEPRAP